MTKLSELKNTHRPAKRTKLLGRGPGSGLGKTCGRGQKGDGARSGYKRRYGYEGGQVPLYRKLPTRGFTRGAFIKRLDAINLDQIEKMYNDGETVNVASLKERGYFSGPTIGIKILANGAIAKKLKIEANAFSKGAEVKLKEAGIEYILVNDLKI